MKRLPPAIRALRPAQWTKNGIVLAAVVFALGDHTQQVGLEAIPRVLLAALVFCILSSSVYLINDIRDLPLDRAHPVKRFRPIAAGELSVGLACLLALLLVVASLTGAWFLGSSLWLVCLAYLLMQMAYTMILKQVALVDLFVIAFGFVLRALAGAVVLDIHISPWLLLCTLLLALFLALCKRRHEKINLCTPDEPTRPALQNYQEKLLDQLIAVMAPAVILCYAIYTLWPETIEKYGSSRLALTIPFVIFGLFRYLDLVYRHEKGDRPEQLLLTDIPLIVNLLLYGLTVLLALHLPG